MPRHALLRAVRARRGGVPELQERPVHAHVARVAGAGGRAPAERGYGRRVAALPRLQDEPALRADRRGQVQVLDVHVQRDARLMQLVFFQLNSAASRGYQGRFQSENI